MQTIIIRIADSECEAEDSNNYSVITVNRDYLTSVLKILNESNLVQYFYVSDGVNLFDQVSLGYDHNAYPKLVK
ncbi:MAG: hypothetical protein A2381_15270 [Bdellovibrionales bacterium RIFOXYB1_FULL_37_110]|nr:MAG: hypothetical protein A2381_15270 [Bdellovibrionales bacterium RIFOXYB1_FULL_37_110]